MDVGCLFLSLSTLVLETGSLTVVGDSLLILPSIDSIVYSFYRLLILRSIDSTVY